MLLLAIAFLRGTIPDLQVESAVVMSYRVWVVTHYHKLSLHVLYNKFVVGY